jgi:hypothetical protein
LKIKKDINPLRMIKFSPIKTGTLKNEAIFWERNVVCSPGSPHRVGVESIIRST